MDDDLFGAAVPSFSKLRIQRKSLGAFDFGYGKNGLYPLKGNPALAGTALDDAVFGTLLLPGPGKAPSVDLWPIFHTGVPNLAPYQLPTGKNGNPLAGGKPFIHNFLPNGADMLRLNMATPVTPRNDPMFSSEGIIAAAVIGLTQAPFNTSTALEFIPNMDGFPNGRRLEDDVTRIELHRGRYCAGRHRTLDGRLQREQSQPEPGDQPAAEQPAIQYRRGNERRAVPIHLPLRGRSVGGTDI